MEEADALCDRVALMHLGLIRADGTPDELKAAIGPDATLEDVFRRYTGNIARRRRGEGRLPRDPPHPPDRASGWLTCG